MTEIKIMEIMRIFFVKNLFDLGQWVSTLKLVGLFMDPVNEGTKGTLVFVHCCMRKLSCDGLDSNLML